MRRVDRRALSWREEGKQVGKGFYYREKGGVVAMERKSEGGRKIVGRRDSIMSKGRKGEGKGKRKL